ncbi:MAG: L-ribulose-5-phosphate 4-epimerase AraD [Planctomycetota bacterium]
MRHETLREQVCDANLRLVDEGLVTLTWGNVSGIDRAAGVVAIKPSGVSYRELSPASIVLVDLDGNVIEGAARPSSDTPTHTLLYRHFPSIGGVTHTHSPNATAFAQARRPIPCLGTTHADHFAGPVPVTRCLGPREVDAGYELATGASIVERFGDVDPVAMPAVLVAGHAPFTWGATATESVANAIALEAVAGMALATGFIRNDTLELEEHVRAKHHARKHGPDAYYGQTVSEDPS